MHRLTVIALTLFVVFASVLPTVLARETNGDRFKRGYPPLPPSRREVAKRQRPSTTPPRTVSGFLQVRDSTGAHPLGFIQNDNMVYLPTSELGVTTDKNSALQGTFTAATKTVQITNVHDSPPFLGVGDPTKYTEQILTLVQDGPGARIWTINAATNEITPPAPETITWDQANNVLDFVPNYSTNAPVVKLYLV